MSPIAGVYPVVATPFTAAGAVDYDAIRAIVETQVERGIDGVVCFGIAAEFYKLTDDERRRVVEVAADATAGTATDLFVSVTDHATRLAVEFAEFVQAAGADGLMLLPPFFLGPSESDILAHARRVGEAVDIPIMVQYAPVQTGVSITPATLADLAASVETIRAFKIESRPPGPYISSLVEAAADVGVDIDVHVGYAGVAMLEAFDRGAVGVVPGASLSDLYRDVVDHLRAGRRSEAVAVHTAMLPLLSFMIQDIEGFIHYEKHLLAAEGLVDAVHAREPAFEPDPHTDARFEECLAALAPHRG
jgi:4-hydroxy-tetrahydrodipicolinate synthase